PSSADNSGTTPSTQWQRTYPSTTYYPAFGTANSYQYPNPYGTGQYYGSSTQYTYPASAYYNYYNPYTTNPSTGTPFTTTTTTTTGATQTGIPGTTPNTGTTATTANLPQRQTTTRYPSASYYTTYSPGPSSPSATGPGTTGT